MAVCPVCCASFYEFPRVAARVYPTPSARPPLTVPGGTKWRFLPPRPPKLTVAATVAHVVMALMRFIFGAVYFKDCPQQPNIPNFLLGLALAHVLIIPFVTFPCESDAAWPKEHPKGCKAFVLCVSSLFLRIWVLAGVVWVFSVYQPNYDPTAADGLYCNKTLYTFAFWNVVWEVFAFCCSLAKLCRVLVSNVETRPAPTNRDFYRLQV